MPPDRSFSPEDVARLVARWSGGSAWRIEPSPDGVSTPVYRLTRGRETRYLRLAEQPGENRIAERRAHDLLRARGARVPEVVWFEPRAPEVDRSAMITSPIPGAPIDRTNAATAPAILAAAGRDLARINAIPVRGYGWVVDVAADGGLVAAHRDRASWAAEYLAAVAALPAGGSPDRALLGEVMAGWAARTGSTISAISCSTTRNGRRFRCSRPCLPGIGRPRPASRLRGA